MMYEPNMEPKHPARGKIARARNRNLRKLSLFLINIGPAFRGGVGGMLESVSQFRRGPPHTCLPFSRVVMRMPGCMPIFLFSPHIRLLHRFT
jgi:hypothetical protein